MEKYTLIKIANKDRANELAEKGYAYLLEKFSNIIVFYTFPYDEKILEYLSSLGSEIVVLDSSICFEGSVDG